MEKYRLILKWTNEYVPHGFRQDGESQEKVEEVGIKSEDEAKFILEYFNKHLHNGSWIANRYEVDDDKYIKHQLIMPVETKAKEVVPAIKTIVEQIPLEPIAKPVVEFLAGLIDKVSVIESEPKKRVKRQAIEYLERPEENKPIEVLKLEEILGPTKTIYVTKYLDTQKNIGPDVVKINGRVAVDERADIYDKFNKNFIEKISVTEAVIRLGGVHYDKNGKEIDVIFLDDIDFITQENILKRINLK